MSMPLIQERKTPAQNIAFLGILAGVVVVLSVLGGFLPVVSFLVVFILAAASALGTRITSIRYSLPFMIAASLLSVAASFFNLTEALFYFVPSILAGGIYGIMSRNKLPLSLAIFVGAVLTLAFNYAAFFFIKGVYEIDIIEDSLKILGLAENTHVRPAIPAFLLGIGLAEMVLSHILIGIFYERFSLNTEEGWSVILIPSLAVFFSGLGVGIGFVSFPVGLAFVVSGVFFGIMSVYYLLTACDKLLWILSGVAVLVGIFLFATLHRFMPEGSGILLASLFPSLFGLIMLIFVRRIKWTKKESKAK